MNDERDELWDLVEGRELRETPMGVVPAGDVVIRRGAAARIEPERCGRGGCTLEVDHKGPHWRPDHLDPWIDSTVK